ncbi:MAG: hypothetical protein E6973_01170, partial [Enterobacter hormaechei]|nr:hypothetical protein [Enterobacter hormaechei]
WFDAATRRRVQQLRQMRVVRGAGLSPSRREGGSRWLSPAVASERLLGGISAVVGFSTQLSRGTGSATRLHSRPSAKADWPTAHAIMTIGRSFIVPLAVYAYV